LLLELPAGWSDCGKLAAASLEVPVPVAEAVVLLVSDDVAGMPAFALAVPGAVSEVLPEMFGVAPGVVLPVAPADVPAEAVVSGVVLVPVCVEAVALGAVALVDAEPVPLTPAVLEVEPEAVVLSAVDGADALAEVPGAVAEVLPMVDELPVCAAVPEAVVELPGFVVAVLGLFVAVGEVDCVLFAWVEPAPEALLSL
jgi:hypothetical protein